MLVGTSLSNLYPPHNFKSDPTLGLRWLAFSFEMTSVTPAASHFGECVVGEHREHDDRGLGKLLFE